jgi:hypothetical protein
MVVCARSSSGRIVQVQIKEAGGDLRFSMACWPRPMVTGASPEGALRFFWLAE